MNRLKRFKSENNASSDELWLVIDRDNWPEKDLLEIREDCIKNNFNFIISNPCFELWLVLHQENPKTPLSVKECEKELKKLIPSYSKSNFSLNTILDHIESAIKKAKELDSGDPIIQAPMTDVYRLSEKLSLEN